MRCWRDGTSALKPMVKSLRMGNIIIWFFISIFQISKPSKGFWFSSCLFQVCLFRVSREKSDKEIMREIQAIMRQIASSITYLPCIDEPCNAMPPTTLFSGCWVVIFTDGISTCDGLSFRCVWCVSIHWHGCCSSIHLDWEWPQTDCQSTDGETAFFWYQGKIISLNI